MYIVIELQTNNGKTANIVNAYDDLYTAFNKYHSILAAAAVSTVEVHTALILTETGGVVRAECFDRREQAE